MQDLGSRIADSKAEVRAPRFSPAGQSTQLIVGADASSDSVVLGAASSLYGKYKLRRIYYSAFSPIPDASSLLPARPAPLVREHRLYQADWLMRFYGFSFAEIIGGAANDMLDQEIDPKLAWALRNRDRFPVDVNTADREMLLRVPGLGVRSVDHILRARLHGRLRLDDIRRLVGSTRRIKPFVVTVDHRPTHLLDRSALRTMVAPKGPATLVVRMTYTIAVQPPDDLEAFRGMARRLLAARIDPNDVAWLGERGGDVVSGRTAGKGTQSRRVHGGT